MRSPLPHPSPSLSKGREHEKPPLLGALSCRCLVLTRSTWREPPERASLTPTNGRKPLLTHTTRRKPPSRCVAPVRWRSLPEGSCVAFLFGGNPRHKNAAKTVGETEQCAHPRIFGGGGGVNQLQTRLIFTVGSVLLPKHIIPCLCARRQSL